MHSVVASMALLTLSVLIINGETVQLHNPRPKGYKDCKPNWDKSKKIIYKGAAYFLTNDPKGNAVVVNAIKNDGTLKFSHTVLTRGKGMYVYKKDDLHKPKPNGCFSQDCVIVGKFYLFAVNPGSNTVSMFKIDKKNPINIKLINTANTFGDFPISLTYSKKLDMLCVLNGGEKNGVQCFSVHLKKGLTALPGTRKKFMEVKQTNLPNGRFMTFGDILFVRDSSQLLVSIKNNTKFEGFIAAFNIRDKKLYKDPILNKPNGSKAPFSMSIIPNTKERSIIFTDAEVGYGILDLDVEGKETHSLVVPIANRNSTCWSDCSAKHKTCYITDMFSGKVTEASYSSEGGKTISGISTQYDVEGIMLDLRLARIKNKKYLYILSPSLLGVFVMYLKGPREATIIQKLSLEKIAKKLCGVELNFGMKGMAVYIVPEYLTL